MSSSEPSSWMSMGLIPSVGVNVASTTVSECCNGVISWWYGISNNIQEPSSSSNIANDAEETLLEPLVVAEQSAQVMDDRLQTTHEASDLFLDEHAADDDDEDEVQSYPPSATKDIENGALLVTPDSSNDSVQSSPTNVLSDENCDDKTETNLLPEKVESEEILDIENALCLGDSENNPPKSDVSDDETQPTATTTLQQMKQNPPCQEEHQGLQSSSSLPIETNSLQPSLDIENENALLEEDSENIHPSHSEDGFADESPQDDEIQPSTAVLQQMEKILPSQEEHEELQSSSSRSLPIEKNSLFQPSLDIENVLAAMDGDEEECCAHDDHNSKDEEVVSQPSSSIFRSSTPESSDDEEEDAPTIDGIQLEHDMLKDENHQVNESASSLSTPDSSTTMMPPRSNVKKRVSDLIGIFESLSMDEEENHHSNDVTPTSLCSASSFSGAKSASVQQHDTTTTTTCCPCCNKKIYPTDATIGYHDKLFHGGCFKCHLCDRKFSRGLSDVAGLVTNNEGDEGSTTSILTCTKCRDDAAVKHLPLRKSTPACQPITVTSPEKGNIQQVKDEIGDDLESVMDGMIPRCTICGIHFLGSSKSESSDMMIVGMDKYHRKCRMYGRPMVERSERKVLPIVAANYAPESLVIRLCNTRCSDDGDDHEQQQHQHHQQEVMTTLYFVLPDKAADLQRIRSADRPNEHVSFEYTMDSSAYANPNYEGTKKNAKTTFPCHGVGLAESSLSVGFLGDPFGLPIRLANTRITEDRETGALLFCAELECFKFQLRHCFDLVMHHKKGELVDLKTATLSMNIR